MHIFFVILNFIYFKINKILRNAINVLELHNFSLLVEKNYIENIKYVSF